MGGDGETMGHGLWVDLGTEINIWTTHQSPTSTGPINYVHMMKLQWKLQTLKLRCASLAGSTLNILSLADVGTIAGILISPGEGTGSPRVGTCWASPCAPASSAAVSLHPALSFTGTGTSAAFGEFQESLLVLSYETSGWFREAPEPAFGVMAERGFVWRPGPQISLRVARGLSAEGPLWSFTPSQVGGAAPCQLELFRPLDGVKSPRFGRRTRRRENYPDRVWHSEFSKAGCINTGRISKWKCTRGLFNAKSEEILEDMKNFSGILSVGKSGYWNDVSQYAYIHIYIQYTPWSRYLYRYKHPYMLRQILKR